MEDEPGKNVDRYCIICGQKGDEQDQSMDMHMEIRIKVWTDN